MPSVVAPRKLGVSCRVSVPVGSGRATQPSRVWRPGRRRREDHDAHEGRSVDRASWRPSGGPRPRKGWYRVARRVWRTPRVVTRTAGYPRAAAVARLRRAAGGPRPRPAGRETPPHVGGPIGAVPAGKTAAGSTALQTWTGPPGPRPLLAPPRPEGTGRQAGGGGRGQGKPAGGVWGVFASSGRRAGARHGPGAGLDGRTPPAQDAGAGHGRLGSPPAHHPAGQRRPGDSRPAAPMSSPLAACTSSASGRAGAPGRRTRLVGGRARRGQRRRPQGPGRAAGEAPRAPRGPGLAGPAPDVAARREAGDARPGDPPGHWRPARRRLARVRPRLAAWGVGLGGGTREHAPRARRGVEQPRRRRLWVRLAVPTRGGRVVPGALDATGARHTGGLTGADPPPALPSLESGPEPPVPSGGRRMVLARRPTGRAAGHTPPRAPGRAGVSAGPAWPRSGPPTPARDPA
jgi:hypothetical protein